MEPEHIHAIIAAAQARRNAVFWSYASALWRIALKALSGREQHLEYLSGAVDHADLERRLRALERARPPHFVTFNH